MKTIKLRPPVRSAIYQAAKRCVSGGNPLFEVGMRADLRQSAIPQFQANELLWADDADLEDLVRLRDVETLDFDALGRCSLDLYARTGRGDGRQLETNVTVWLLHRDGQTFILGAWEFDGAPDFGKADEEIDSIWEKIISKNLAIGD